MNKLTPATIALIVHVIEQCSEEESQAKALLVEASKPGSLLATYFTWDDGEAAYQWRLSQARTLLVEVRAHVCIAHRPALTFRPIIKTSHVHPGYTTFERVVSSPELQERTRERFLHEITLLCQRYSEYGIPQVNALIRVVCRTLKLSAPVLFNGADLHRKGLGVG